MEGSSQINIPKDIPRHEIPLPSLGKIYPEDYLLNRKNLVDGKYVLIRAMSIQDEDILSSEPLIQSGEAIDEFVKSALGGNVDTGIMIEGDREAIMHAFRATGYGTDYPVEITCENKKCRKQFSFIFDLSKLEMQVLDSYDPVESNTNVFNIDEPLPKTGSKVQIKLLTVKDLKEIDSYLENLSVKAGSKKLPEKSLRMKYSIVTLDGVSDRNKIGKFVDQMPAGDALFLRRKINKISPKVITKQVAKCRYCGHVSEHSLPLDPSFFFPEE
jgi:hypothetical protein